MVRLVPLAALLKTGLCICGLEIGRKEVTCVGSLGRRIGRAALEPGFSSLVPLTFRAGEFLVVGGCAVHPWGEEKAALLPTSKLRTAALEYRARTTKYELLACLEQYPAHSQHSEVC